jgi:hypothetical protein
MIADPGLSGQGQMSQDAVENMTRFPLNALERAMQMIKGGFSFRAKKELGYIHEIWQPSYYDRRVRDAEEYFAFREYIRRNAVKRGLVDDAARYPYCSAWPKLPLDRAPQRLNSLLKNSPIAGNSASRHRLFLLPLSF